MPSYLSRNVYPGLSAGVQSFAISWPYLDVEHVHLYTRANSAAPAVEQPIFTFTSGSLISYTVPAGVTIVELRRQTPRDALLERIGSPSTVTSEILNDMATQLLYIEQEVGDEQTDLNSRALLSPPTEIAPAFPSLVGALGKILVAVSATALAWSTPSQAGIAKGDPGGNVMSTGVATAIPTQTLPAGVDTVRVSGYSSPGRGQGWLLKWNNSWTALPALAAGANAWWWTDLAGNKWFVDPAALSYHMLGAIGDNPSTAGATSGTDNMGAYKAYRQICEWLAAQQVYDEFTAAYHSNPKLYVPGGNYYHSAEIDLDFGTPFLEGEASGPQNGGKRVVFSCGASGFKAFYAGQSVRSGAIGAMGGTVKNISFRYVGAATTNTISGGIINTGQFTSDNCSYIDFPGHGLEITGNSGGSPPTNANLIRVIGGNFRANGRSGVYIAGGDANVVKLEGICNFYGNGEWGVDDNSFLGAHLEDCHTDSNGIVGAGTRLNPQAYGSLCSYGGNRYVVAMGQAATASTQVPGTGSAWILLSTGAAGGIYQAWTTGLGWKEGGPYVTRQAAGQARLDFCYAESTQGPSQFTTTTIAIGGLHAPGIIGGVLLYGLNNAIVGSRIGARNSLADGTIASMILGGGGTAGVVRLYGRDNSGGTAWSDQIDVNNNYFPLYNNGAGTSPYIQHGPTGDHPYCMEFLNGVVIGSVFMDSGTAAPTTGHHSQGDIRKNSAPSVGQPKEWVCTVTGTPGTWVSGGNL